MRAMRMACVVAAISISAACVTSTPCAARYPAGTPRGAFLFDVTGPGPSGSIVILGTHHAAGEADIPPEALVAIDQAELYVAEAPEGGDRDNLDDNQQLARALSLPRGESLRRMLGDEDFDRLEENVPGAPDAIDRMRPWVALSLLIRGVFEFPAPNMPHALVAYARARGIPMHFLERWDMQRDFLDMVVGVEDLRGAIRDYDNLACGVSREVESYRAADARYFVRAELVSTRGPSPAQRAKATAIEIRNEVWARRLASYVSSGRRVFVAIGISNILGPQGIGKRLMDAGFTITRRKDI